MRPKKLISYRDESKKSDSMDDEKYIKRSIENLETKYKKVLDEIKELVNNDEKTMESIEKLPKKLPKNLHKSLSPATIDKIGHETNKLKDIGIQIKDFGKKLIICIKKITKLKDDEKIPNYVPEEIKEAIIHYLDNERNKILSLKGGKHKKSRKNRKRRTKLKNKNKKTKRKTKNISKRSKKKYKTRKKHKITRKKKQYKH